MIVNSYSEAVDYLYKNLPMFQRVGASAYKADLSNTIRLCAALGDPQKKFRSIHVAGTNGKGSTSHMLASILQSAGYRTGLYTSPHLKEFTERIRIDGRPVEKQFVVDFVNRIHEMITLLRPSFFEITVAMAFDYFVQEKVNIAVVEVGLGGRLDSTNVITPLVSVITNIDWDHKEILGDTLPQIASEKAGIIKTGIPVVVSERNPEVDEVFLRKSNDLKCRIKFASDEYAATLNESTQEFHIRKGNAVLFDNLRLPLKGLYQEKNLPGVLAVMDELNSSGFRIEPETIRNGLENVISQTGLKGRWQKLRDCPLVICDTGHNPAGIREVVRQIRQLHYNKLHFVLGVVRDKDISGILGLLPKDASYYFCQAKIPRALGVDLLERQAGEAGLRGQAIPDVNEAYKAAISNAGPEDLVFVGGSTFVVAELEDI